MTDTDKATLKALETLIVNDQSSVAKALETAYELGNLNGQLLVARITEASLGEIMKVLP